MPKNLQIRTPAEKIAIFKYLEDNIYPEGLSKDQKRNFRAKATSFEIIDGILFHIGADNVKRQLICEFEFNLIQNILTTEHSQAHIGSKKLINVLKTRYYGIPNEIVTTFVAECTTCQRYNTIQTIEPVFINDITSKYFRYMMDCVDLRRYSDQNDGYCWILNVIDTYTKYAWSFKLKNKTAVLVKESLKYIFDNFGIPLSIQSDNGKEFRNRELAEFLTSLNIDVIHGRPRNPKSQGQVERLNQTIKRWLAKKLHETNSFRWIDYLSDVVLMYNKTVHSATDKSPFVLFHGQSGFNQLYLGKEYNDDIIYNRYQRDEIYNHALEVEEIFSTFNFENLPEDYIAETEFPVLLNNISTIVQNDNINERYEVSEHFEQYRERIIRNRNSNLIHRNLDIGDRILIKRDFDTNINTIRRPFESFFEEGNYIVCDFLDNNMIAVFDLQTGIVKNVHSTKIKKIN